MILKKLILNQLPWQFSDWVFSIPTGNVIYNASSPLVQQSLILLAVGYLIIWFTEQILVLDMLNHFP